MSCCWHVLIEERGKRDYKKKKRLQNPASRRTPLLLEEGGTMCHRSLIPSRRHLSRASSTTNTYPPGQRPPLLTRTLLFRVGFAGAKAPDIYVQNNTTPRKCCKSRCFGDTEHCLGVRSSFFYVQCKECKF